MSVMSHSVRSQVDDLCYDDVDTPDQHEKETPMYLIHMDQRESSEILERIWKTVIIAALPVGAILFVTDFKLFASCEEILAVVMLTVFLSTSARFVWLIYRAKNMYRVCCQCKVVPNWTTMPVCYKMDEYKKESIHSLSEFSNIKGGAGITSLLGMSEHIWMLMLSWFVFTLTHSKPQSRPDIVNLKLDHLLMMIGVFGLLLQSIWQFNPWSAPQRMMHYLGRIAWSVVIMAYGLASNWNNTFFALISLFVVFFLLCLLLSIKADIYGGDSPALVNRYSKSILLCELFMLWQGIAALLLWFYYYEYYHA